MHEQFRSVKGKNHLGDLGHLGVNRKIILNRQIFTRCFWAENEIKRLDESIGKHRSEIKLGLFSE